MSHRVSIKSSITNAAACEAALKSKNWTYSLNNNIVHVTGGPMRGASINLRTGEVAGDSDYHRASNSEGLGALNQAYAEQLIRMDVASKGGYIEECITQRDGTVRMVANLSFA